MTPLENLARLGIALPPVSVPAAAYVPFVQSGRQIWLSGHIARQNGAVWTGKLGDTLATPQGQAAARAVAIDLLGTLHAAAGDLNRVARIVKLVCLVSSAPDYTEQHLVANGASELLAEVFGPQGQHARSAYGVAQLPLGACVEIELVAELADREPASAFA